MNVTTRALLASCALTAAVIPAALRADEFLAMPGLWQTVYEAGGRPGAPRVVWHCVDEAADPWVSFAQLEDLPGMACAAHSRQRSSTSLKWHAHCHGAGRPDTVADVVEVSGAVIFDSPTHYRGEVQLQGTLMGAALLTVSKVEGTRRAACTSPAD